MTATQPVRRDYTATVKARLAELRARQASAATPATSVASLIDAWLALPRDIEFGVSPAEFQAAVAAARTEGGVAAVAALVRGTMLAAIERAQDVLPTREDLAPISDYFQRAFALMLGAARDATDEVMDPDHDLIRKDLAVALLRAWPTGTMLVEPRSWYPRRPLVTTGSAMDRMRGALALATLGPNRPYYQQHLYDRFLPSLTPEGWTDCVLRTAALLERDPVARGIAGVAWFWDPAVERISPRIAFVRALPARNGAYFHPFPNKSDTLHNATVNSSERIQAIAEGRYVPQEHMLVWHRSNVLRWASESRK